MFLCQNLRFKAESRNDGSTVSKKMLYPTSNYDVAKINIPDNGWHSNNNDIIYCIVLCIVSAGVLARHGLYTV